MKQKYLKAQVGERLLQELLEVAELRIVLQADGGVEVVPDVLPAGVAPVVEPWDQVLGQTCTRPQPDRQVLGGR